MAIPGRPVRCRLFHVQNKRKPRRCHASTVAGWTTRSAERQPRDRRDIHTQSTRSADVKRRRGRRERFATRQLMPKGEDLQMQAARERTNNRREWTNETTTDTMRRAYSE